ncbi:hypothetical protein BGZ46_008178, partial [Entomortierella lignicola]
GHSNYIWTVVYSPKGDQVASGGDDKTVRLCDVVTGKCIHTLRGHNDKVEIAVYSPKGNWIVSGSDDKTVRLWSVETGQCEATISGFSVIFASLAWKRDSDSLFLVTCGGAKSDISFKDVHGLSRLNQDLITQPILWDLDSISKQKRKHTDIVDKHSNTRYRLDYDISYSSDTEIFSKSDCDTDYQAEEEDNNEYDDYARDDKNGNGVLYGAVTGGEMW